MRTNHAIILVVSVGIFLFSAKKIYDKFKSYLYCSSFVSAYKPAQINLQDKIEADKVGLEETKNDNETQNTTSPQLNEGATIRQDVEQQSKIYKFTIRYENKKAKNVKLSGSFWAWKEREMRRISNGVWEEELVLKDKGVYKYYFVVDGKRMLDPKAKITADGKFSIFEIR